ncbi:outer membrane lipoprotein carrier protein LolA [Desulfovibrio mangrovi]|uniref:LolA family protein n=1 Tax=Desulfovibrio mangrovi TaxID=2976983 RepID=UPI002245E9D4|nr:outer membrane lipoprotein carrier protein LolA [Desulfovibrio mangrovi]UZP68283.1 outer membrane lipoprotein carrier protein LolA [Desulfovibrio mangrovi]
MCHIRSIFRSVAIATGLSLLLAAQVMASDVTDGIQKRYRAAKSMTAQFSQVLRHKESGSVENRAGSFYFKAPERIRWVTETPAPELLVVNPEAVWNYFKDEEVAYKYPASLVHETKTALRFITGKANLEDDFYVETAPSQDGLTVLHLFAKEPTTDLTEATLWISPEYEVARILTVDFYGNENEIRFKDMAFDKPLEDNFFDFTPPKGVDVEDRTQSVPEQKIKE